MEIVGVVSIFLATAHVVFYLSRMRENKKDSRWMRCYRHHVTIQLIIFLSRLRGKANLSNLYKSNKSIWQ